MQSLTPDIRPSGSHRPCIPAFGDGDVSTGALCLSSLLACPQCSLHVSMCTEPSPPASTPGQAVALTAEFKAVPHQVVTRGRCLHSASVRLSLKMGLRVEPL